MNEFNFYSILLAVIFTLMALLNSFKLIKILGWRFILLYIFMMPIIFIGGLFLLYFISMVLSVVFYLLGITYDLTISSFIVGVALCLFDIYLMYFKKDKK